jgi:hypothetical protein
VSNAETLGCVVLVLDVFCSIGKRMMTIETQMSLPSGMKLLSRHSIVNLLVKE